jgi:hypothetical protein
MRTTLLRLVAYALGALAALALVLLLPLAALGATYAAHDLLTADPGPLQLGALLVAALALRPEPAPAPAPAVLELDDDALLFHLLTNCEVA